TVVVTGTPQVVEKVVEKAPTTPVQISWFDWDIGTNAPQEIVKIFMEDYPHIQVEVQGAPGGEYYQKLQTLLAAGIAPDVLNFQSWRWQPFAKRKSIQPIEDLVERDNWRVPFAERWAKLWEPQIFFRGRLYAEPYNTAPMVMFYLKDRFDEAGIPYPTADWTEDEFKDLCVKLTYEKGGIKYYGYQSNTSYERLACWMRMNGEKEWDTENEPRKALWTQPTIVDALQWQLYECFNTLKVSPTPADIQGGTNQIQTGHAAMKMEGAWFLPQMQGPKAAVEGGIRFDVVAMPKGKDGRRHMGFAHVQTINAATRNLEAAWTLLKYIGDEKAQRLWSEMTGRQPNNPDFIERFWAPKAREQFNFENTQAFIDAMDTGIVHVTGLYDITIYNEIFNPFRDAVVAGKATVPELIDGVNKALQAMCDEYWAEG
ncbi:MAG: extracellular solute-binding protein, partial [Synergistales bacterium]|nr:extracellular solute-binding protein [Synergistales bacterium]